MLWHWRQGHRYFFKRSAARGGKKVSLKPIQKCCHSSCELFDKKSWLWYRKRENSGPQWQSKVVRDNFNKRLTSLLENVLPWIFSQFLPVLNCFSLLIFRVPNILFLRLLFYLIRKCALGEIFDISLFLDPILRVYHVDWLPVMPPAENPSHAGFIINPTINTLNCRFDKQNLVCTVK